MFWLFWETVIKIWKVSLLMIGLLLMLILTLFLAWQIYKFIYYRSEKFNHLKDDLNNYIVECNDLNGHIEELKETYADVKKNNYGVAQLKDNSKYNFKRTHQLQATKSEYIYDCSATVCKNAEMQPFKYLCKYFNIKVNEESLEKFENVLNNFSAVEEGKRLLNNELNRIQSSIENDIPFLIRKFDNKKFMQKLGFQTVDFKTVYFPVYTFRYVSAGGNKSTHCNIKLDVRNLNDFVEYLFELIKFKKSAKGQRALMTSKLREKIKQRDNYTCQNCNLSTHDEPNLLLEIDHIIPISKGGMSSEDNLQTLCWKCNRSKGSKIAS